MNIILASGSIYRKELLNRLKIHFTTYTPDINENLPIESHSEYVETLSVNKALAALKQFPDSCCIGCDTIATLGKSRLGKPINFEKAKQQLQQLSGQTVKFYSGIGVVTKDQVLQKSLVTEVVFRELSLKMIEYYLTVEEPFQSCGSFKSETFGCSLISRCSSDDPSAIIGLPLLTLCDMLQRVGIDIFTHPQND